MNVLLGDFLSLPNREVVRVWNSVSADQGAICVLANSLLVRDTHVFELAVLEERPLNATGAIVLLNQCQSTKEDSFGHERASSSLSISSCSEAHLERSSVMILSEVDNGLFPKKRQLWVTDQ